MISVIIPHWPKNDYVNGLLENCRKTLTGYDELILVVNEGIGFGAAINWGFKMAKGDYLVLVSNDVEIGDVSKLCDPDAVTCPIVNGLKQEFWGCCFCLPRWVYEKVGGFDEQFKMAFFEDDDYIMRFRQAGIPMRYKEVEAKTLGGQTLKDMPEKNDFYNENREKFMKKWGVHSSNPVRYDF